MIAKMATIAAMPATGLTSSFAIWPSDLPSRRIDAHRIDEVLHGAAEDDAGDQPDRAGQEAELRGERRARRAARRRRSPRSDGRRAPSVEVGTKSRPLLSRSAGVARRASRPKTLAAMNRE